MNRAAIGLLLLLGGAPLSARADGGDATDMTGERELHMMQCPSAAPGAKTTVESTPDGVALHVTAPTEFGRREIRRRAAAQEAMAQKPAPAYLEHTGQGTGSRRYGFCPGMREDTTVRATDTQDGARITVRAKNRADVRELQRSTRARVARLEAHKKLSSR